VGKIERIAEQAPALHLDGVGLAPGPVRRPRPASREYRRRFGYPSRIRHCYWWRTRGCTTSAAHGERNRAHRIKRPQRGPRPFAQPPPTKNGAAMGHPLATAEPGPGCCGDDGWGCRANAMKVVKMVLRLCESFDEGEGCVGDLDLSAEIGSGSTPRNWAGSMATDAAARPRSGEDLGEQATERWQDMLQPIRGRPSVTRQESHGPVRSRCRSSGQVRGWGLRPLASRALSIPSAGWSAPTPANSECRALPRRPAATQPTLSLGDF
jgi:hypothetical protein